MQCPKCKQDNPRYARICRHCYSRLPLPEKSTKIWELLRPLTRTSFGELGCWGIIIVLICLLPLLHPPETMLQELWLQFALLGLVTFGLLFSLAKEHIDLSLGPLAGAAASVALLASENGIIAAFLAPLALGGVIGLFNGFMVKLTTIPSWLLTLIVGEAAAYSMRAVFSASELKPQEDWLGLLGTINLGSIPLPVFVFILVLLGGYFLLQMEYLLPAKEARTERGSARRSGLKATAYAFSMGGMCAGFAGFFIAAAQFPLGSPDGRTNWLLAPLAALLLGGAKELNSTGRLRFVIAGSAGLALLEWFCIRLHIPLGGSIAEGLIIILALLLTRWRNLNWEELAQIQRRHLLLAHPKEGRSPVLPRFMPFLWPQLPVWLKPTLALSGISLFLSTYAYVGFYATRYVPPESAVIVEKMGWCEIRKYNAERLEALVGTRVQQGDTITLGPASEVLLRFSDGSTLRLYANTTLTIQQYTERSSSSRTARLYMPGGRLFASLRRLWSPDSSFEIDSPLITVGVRGTKFLMVVEAERSFVEVIEGIVQVTRKYLERDIRTGATITREERQVVNSGEWIAALLNRSLGTPQQLSREEQQALQEEGEKVVAELLRLISDFSFWRSLLTIILAISLLYLFFAYVQPPPPPTNALDMARRAAELRDRRQRTPEDSANAAALVELYLQAGQIDEAKAELEAIVRVDPNSEYGQWAQRLLARLRELEHGGS